MDYTGEIATIQQRIAESSDLHRRRLAVIDALAVRSGEQVLEVGCGGGPLLPPLAASAGPDGRVIGIDISPDQIAVAERRCADLASAEAMVADVNALPFTDGSFDAVGAIQVIEYLAEPGRALAELRRVSRPGARLVILSTVWDTMFWNSGKPELTARIAKAWRRHAPHPNLPADLRPLLDATGYRLIRQAPVTIMSNAWHEDAFPYWIARLIVAYVTGAGLIAEPEAEEWLRGLGEAERAGTFFFGSLPVLSLAVAE